MLIGVVNTLGEEVEQIELPDEVFGISPNMAVLHDSIVTYLANQRKGTKSALTRAEVSGGGCKPWRQKGTGHARQGSTRAPQWRHGGIVFAPKPRDYSRSLSKKARKLAMRSVLSLKHASGDLVILEDFSLDSYKTKTIVNVLSSLNAKKASLILREPDKFILKSSANIEGLTVLSSGSMNSYDIFYHKKLIIFKSAISKICENFASDKREDKKVVA